VADVSARKLVRSSLALNLGQAWQIISRFVLTPVILAKLGLEGFGAWVLVCGLTNYLAVVDTSFSTAYAKLTAEFDRRRDYDLLSEAIGSGMAVIGMVGVVGVGLLYVIGPLVLPLLGVPEDLLAGASSALFLVSIAVGLRLSLGCMLQVLDGLQRLDLRVQVNVLGSMVDFAFSLALLYLDFGLVALGSGLLAGRVVAITGAWVLVSRLLPQLRVSPRRLSRRGLGTILSLGARFQLLAVMNTVIGEAIRMMMSALCGIAVLGAFSLSRRLLSLATIPASSIIAPLLAAFANLEAGGDQERWELLLRRASKFLACAALVALVFIALFADALLFAWTGQRVELGSFTVRVLAIGTFFRLLTAVGTTSLRAAGTVRLEFLYGILGSVASLVGVLLGYAIAGYTGIVVALTSAQVLGAAYFIQAFAATRNVSLRRYLVGAVLLPAAAVAPALLLLQIGSRWLPGLGPQVEARLLVLASLGIAAGVYALASAPLFWWGVLSIEDRTAVMGVLRAPPG
jgi:O-antigen/teichoic acid export membrane protein